MKRITKVGSCIPVTQKNTHKLSGTAVLGQPRAGGSDGLRDHVAVRGRSRWKAETQRA